tara:strand:+ start:111 stop:1007 length:897 start_codon:yes stop_codon:yes gene_type:complete
MNNTLVLSTPRSGTNFLGQALTENSNTFNAGEFFQPAVSEHYKHLEYLSWYVSVQYRVNYAMEVYKKLFDYLSKSDTLRIPYKENLFNPEQLGLLIDFINLEMSNKNNRSYLTQRAKNKNKLLLKVFYDQYYNKFNIYKIVEMVDNVVLLHRENILNKYISHEKANKTKKWTCFSDSDVKKFLDTKIQWNLKKYTNYYIRTLRHTKYHLNIIRNTDKKTAIIKYENFDNNINSFKYIKNIFEKQKIDCTLPTPNHMRWIPMKQANKSLDIGDNFINKEEFLDDYPKIQDKILLRVEEL